MITLPRIIICISFVGVVLLNHMKNRWGFVVFGISAFLWSVYDIGLGEYEHAAASAVSSAVSFYGFWRWGRIQ